MAKLEKWELRDVITGITWHDRRRDEECAKFGIRSPYKRSELSRSEFVELAAGMFGGVLGDMTPKSNQETRNAVFKREVTFFDYQYILSGGFWEFTFKVVDAVDLDQIEDKIMQIICDK